MNRSRQANADMRARALVQGEESEPWPFECECGEPDCREHVTLSVARYDEVRRVTGHVVAAPHRDRYYRARQARAQAAEIREEARAVRAQAALQIRRTLKLRRLGPDTRYCVRCGYGVAAVDQPIACPTCSGTSWQIAPNTAKLFRYIVATQDGDVLDSFESRVPEWDVGDTVILADNRRFRVTGTISVERIAEFVDRPTYGLIEVEPL